MIRRPPISTLLPYATLFRSAKVPSPPSTPSACSHGTRGARRPRSPSSPSAPKPTASTRSEEHTSELQSRPYLVCRLLLEIYIENKRLRRLQAGVTSAAPSDQ